MEIEKLKRRKPKTTETINIRVDKEDLKYLRDNNISVTYLFRWAIDEVKETIGE